MQIWKLLIIIRFWHRLEVFYKRLKIFKETITIIKGGNRFIRILLKSASAVKKIMTQDKFLFVRKVILRISMDPVFSCIWNFIK